MCGTAYIIVSTLLSIKYLGSCVSFYIPHILCYLLTVVLQSFAPQLASRCTHTNR